EPVLAVGAIETVIAIAAIQVVIAVEAVDAVAAVATEQPVVAAVDLGAGLRATIDLVVAGGSIQGIAEKEPETVDFCHAALLPGVPISDGYHLMIWHRPNALI